MENIAWAWRDEIRKAEAWLDFKLMSNRKGNKKNFWVHWEQKENQRKCRSAAELGRWLGDEGCRKDRLTQCLFCLGSYWPGLLLGFLSLCGRGWEKEMLLMVDSVGIRNRLSKLDIYKNMGVDRIHQRLLMELVYVIVMLLSIIFEGWKRRQDFLEDMMSWFKPTQTGSCWARTLHPNSHESTHAILHVRYKIHDKQLSSRFTKLHKKLK